MINGTFSIIGGDLRSAYIAQLLIEEEYNVQTVGLELSGIVDAKYQTTLDEALNTADYCILPLPLLDKNGKMMAAFSESRLDVYSIIAKMRREAMLFGGRIPPVVLEHARRCDREIIDYYQREELQIMNAVPTAEGTVEMIMKQIPTTVSGARILITGFGRTAQALSVLLRAMGANVTVAARKREQQAHARSIGCEAMPVGELANRRLPFEVLINTVPAKIVTPDVIDRVAPGCYIIDIASAPGGVDVGYAMKRNLVVECALSLPGQVAPKSAGNYIKETILNILEERGSAQ